jgi:hypothetical protein
MKKIPALFLLAALPLASLYAQREKEKEKNEKNNGFKKENLFTGGSVSLAFYNNTFLVGASPVFGVSLTNHVDLGLVVNYNYTSYRDYLTFNDRLHQYLFGGGAFLKLYPVRFLFGQVQAEHNFITQKYIPASGSALAAFKNTTSANSLLVGGGYCTGRMGKGKRPFYYLSVLFDVSGNTNSPYTDAFGRTIPIIRGGIQVPLFQHEMPAPRRRRVGPAPNI